MDFPLFQIVSVIKKLMFTPPTVLSHMEIGVPKMEIQTAKNHTGFTNVNWLQSICLLFEKLRQTPDLLNNQDKFVSKTEVITTSCCGQ